MNRLDPQLRAYILHSLCEGMSQRACERIFGVSNKTVAKLFEEAGDMAISWVAGLRDLTPKTIQADEIHSFVAAKQRNVDIMQIPSDEAGTVWGYLAMCADTKLIFSYWLGDHSIPDAKRFARDIASKLKRASDGSFEVRPSIITDGLLAYDEAFDIAFGSDANRATMIEKYETIGEDGKRGRKRYVGADREVRVGEVDTSDIHTSYIERQNLNLRMGNRRYNRRTNAFSKTLLNHERHLALWIMYHNLCWIPRPGRPPKGPDGKRGPWVKKDPAGIAAGVTNHLWEIEDILALTDEFTAQQRLAAMCEVNLGENEPVSEAPQDGEPTHWVFHHFGDRRTKVHRSDCVHCRGGLGRAGKNCTSGEWLPFFSEDEAIAAAHEIEPDKNSICRICIGSYNTLGYRHEGSSRQSPSDV